VTLPTYSDLAPALADFFETPRVPRGRRSSPGSQELGLNVDGDLEWSLGRRVVEALS
jgi:hypothetical protein